LLFILTLLIGMDGWQIFFLSWPAAKYMTSFFKPYPTPSPSLLASSVSCVIIEFSIVEMCHPCFFFFLFFVFYFFLFFYDLKRFKQNLEIQTKLNDHQNTT
jgi:hypothetical protein